MTESLESLMGDSNNFKDPAKFNEMLELSKSPQPEASEAEDAEAESEEIIEEADTEADAEAEAQVEETPEEKQLSESEQQSVKYFKELLKREQERNQKLELQMAEVTQFLQQQYSQADNKQEEASDPEFLDEDLAKWVKAELAKRDKQDETLSAQQELTMFQAALQQQEAIAKSRYEDFDDAFKTYQQREVQRFRAMGYPEEAAANVAGESMQKLAFAAWKQGHDLADMFYGLAQSVGYQGKGKKHKPTPNLEALERNQKRSGKKQADTIAPDIGGSKTVVESMKKKYNPRANDSMDQFKKLLAQARASVS